MIETQFDISTILSIMPHRYPFLLVDRITGLDPWKSIAAYKNVTFNEPHFQGHFPGQPVMPGVLIVEAMGQTAAMFIALSLKHAPDAVPDGVSLPELEGRVAFFAGFDKVKFRRQVIPGDRLDMEVKLLRLGSRIWKVAATATVDGQKTAEAEMTAALS
ncbi:3-hydroxyacyl-[acyl-carrier-protein] dehydratase FabZ [Deltaproteobacteria bacterium Smac51]|nr:3-hydroxyacyl-[acyl-carrier-protein] dehydratase FabZ [Deltaproteobacteria bacterium Smac51]